MIRLVTILKGLLNEEHNDSSAQKLDAVLSKYKKLTKSLITLMGPSFREHIDGIFITSGKPTTFKVHLKNHQYFFMAATAGPVPLGQKSTGEKPQIIYEATVLGKRYLLSNEGNIQRAITAISRLLRYGPSLEKKGPDEETPASSSKAKPSTKTSTTSPEEKPANVPEGPLGAVEEPNA